MEESVGYGAGVSVDTEAGKNLCATHNADNAQDVTTSEASEGEKNSSVDTPNGDVSDSITDTENGAEPLTDGIDADGEMAKNDADAPVDYEQIIKEDLAILRANFPELSGIRDISELSGAMRYAALRDLGLTAIEAYLATSQRVVKRDTRSHLSSAVSHTAGIPGGSMSRGELAVARELFSGMTDSELYNLYKRVTH